MTTITREQAIASAKEISKEFRSLIKELDIKAAVKTKPMASCVIISIDASKAPESAIEKLHELRRESKEFWLSINIHNWSV